MHTKTVSQILMKPVCLSVEFCLLVLCWDFIFLYACFSLFDAVCCMNQILYFYPNVCIKHVRIRAGYGLWCVKGYDFSRDFWGLLGMTLIGVHANFEEKG